MGYGILQPLFQSFVTRITPTPKRGAANATYLLSYDIGIGSLLIGAVSASLGISKGFAFTAAAYILAGFIYAIYIDKYYKKLTIISN